MADPEVLDRRLQLLDRRERPKSEELLLEHTHQALGAAVVLRFPDEGRTALDREEPKVVLIDVGHELAAVVVAHLQARPTGNGFAMGPERLSHRLAERLQGLEVGAQVSRMDAQAPGREVIDDEKDGRVPSPVRVDVGSVPQKTSGRSGMIVPSSAFGPWALPSRVGARRSASCMSRKTRRAEVRTSCTPRRAQTFRLIPARVGPT